MYLKRRSLFMSTIAVIIPCYNGWKHMSECIASLEKQTVPPDQVIFIDDCSKDDSYLQSKLKVDEQHSTEWSKNLRRAVEVSKSAATHYHRHR